MPERELRDAVGEAYRIADMAFVDNLLDWKDLSDGGREEYRIEADALLANLRSLGLEIVRRDEGKE